MFEYYFVPSPEYIFNYHARTEMIILNAIVWNIGYYYGESQIL